MANSEIITLVHSAGNKNNNNNNNNIKIIINNNKINVGQRAKLAARPAGILPVLPMASPPLLRPINRALCKRPFRMISLEQILAQIRPGTGCGRGFKGRVLSHSDSTASQTLSEVCSRGHSVWVPCSPWASFGPRALSRSAWTQLLPSPQSERNARSQLFGWLADLRSVTGHASQPYRQTASSLGVLEAMREYA